MPDKTTKAKATAAEKASADRRPSGDLLIRTMAMPADTNPSGDIFGGWVLSQMDIAGGVLSKQKAMGRTVTIAVDAMTFHRPVLVGDVLCCYGEVKRVGNTSVTIKLEAWVKRELGDDRILVTEGTFTYVAVDETRRPRKITRN